MRKWLSLFVLAVMVINAGCSQAKTETLIPNSKKLIIEKRINSQENYEKLKELTEPRKINSVLTILRQANWENAEVSMVHPPDFIMNTIYEIWITPDRKRLEIVINGKSKHTILNEKDSKAVYEIITNEKLSE